MVVQARSGDMRLAEKWGKGEENRRKMGYFGDEIPKTYCSELQITTVSLSQESE